MPKQRRSNPKAAEQEPVKVDWRNLAAIFVPLVLIAIGFATYLTIINGPRKLTEADRAMLRDYDGIRAALARDDLLTAKNAGAVFVQAHGAQNVFAPSAAILAKAESLPAARQAFSKMSEEAVTLVHKNRDYLVMGCSMDRCPVKCASCEMMNYSDWVQLEPTVANPFMGTKSPSCGIVKSGF